MPIPQNTWLVDFEYHSPEGEIPCPICMVARNYRTGKTIRIWLWGDSSPRLPIEFGPDSLFVAYLASAELSCFLALNWPFPIHVLDLYAEFCLMTSGRTLPTGRGLLGALDCFGLGGIAPEEKEEYRSIAIRGGPFSKEERLALLDYCESDVVALARLLERVWPKLDLPRALIRGRYMGAVAKTERTGIPIATEELAILRENWSPIVERLIIEVDKDYGVYEGTSFREKRFDDYCQRKGIRWPRHESGSPVLNEKTFRTMAKIHPQLQPLHELRVTLNQMRLKEIPVGSDGRNRYMTGVFRSKTGRNQPSSSQAIFGPSCWIRSLIKPNPGMALAYVDHSQQEFGIAAAKSRDEKMIEAYLTGDPYLAFAKMAGAIPLDATKESHPVEREIYKVAALAILMGMGPYQLGVQTKTCEATGRRLLRQHKELFSRFWKWSDDQVDRAFLENDFLTAAFGWSLCSYDQSDRTYRNFPLQANGAEMLRLAAIAITERNIPLCAMVHDAVLIEAPVDEIHEVVAKTQVLMGAASRTVLDGFEIGTDADIVKYPDRYSDKRGTVLWVKISSLAGIPRHNPQADEMTGFNLTPPPASI